MITAAIRDKCQSQWLKHGHRKCTGCTRSLKKDGMRMLLTNTPAPHLVVDLDKYPRQENETRCDYLFVADNGDGWAAPIEITSGVWKTGDKIVEQLQAGAKLAEQIIPPTLSPKLRPVFVGKSKRIKAKESRKLQISFRGQDYPITMCPDGRISKAFK